MSSAYARSSGIAVVAGLLEGLILITAAGEPRALPPGVPVSDLNIDGACFIPLTDDVRVRFCQAGLDAGPVEGFYELSEGVVRWARELSQGRMVLYVHSEFHGGQGIHAAIAWHEGSVIFGPCFTKTAGEVAEPHYQVADGPDMAINLGLRALGVHAEGRDDEFATVGLGKFRWTGEWVGE